MAGAAFTVALEDAAAQAMFAQLLSAGRNLRPLLSEIGSSLQQSTKDRFVSQSGPDGIHWAALSDFTLSRKKTDRILYERGDLADSIAVELGADFLQLSAGPVEYAAVHQFGNPNNRLYGKALAPIPARPYLGLSDEDQAEILDAMQGYLQDALRGI